MLAVIALVLSIVAIGIALTMVWLTLPRKVKSIYPDQPPYYVNRFTGEKLGKHYNPKE
jgi:hypothetical protein